MAGTLTLTFGERLRYTREHAGMKQAELAVHLGVARTTIANWENDENHPAPIYRREMARMFEQPEWFFDLEDVSFTRASIQGYRPPRLVRLPNVA